jgi:hypothetical protein
MPGFNLEMRDVIARSSRFSSIASRLACSAVLSAIVALVVSIVNNL